MSGDTFKENLERIINSIPDDIDYIEELVKEKDHYKNLAQDLQNDKVDSLRTINALRLQKVANKLKKKVEHDELVFNLNNKINSLRQFEKPTTFNVKEIRSNRFSFDDQSINKVPMSPQDIQKYLDYLKDFQY